MTPGRAPDRRPRTLADHLAQGPISLEFALDCAVSLADNLIAIHGKGCVHGEVSLSRLLMGEPFPVLLPPTQERARARVRDDIAGFGTVLESLLAAAALAEKAPDGAGTEPLTRRASIFQAAGGIAARCQDHPDGYPIQRASVSLRLLSVLAGQSGARSPAASVPARPPAAAARPRPAQGGVDPKSFLTDEDPERHLVPSQESCPKCGAHYVALSRPRGWFETGMCHVGLPIRRCCLCFYRYFTLLGMSFTKLPRS